MTKGYLTAASMMENGEYFGILFPWVDKTSNIFYIKQGYDKLPVSMHGMMTFTNRKSIRGSVNNG